MKKLGWILSVVFMFVTGLYLASITREVAAQATISAETEVPRAWGRLAAYVPGSASLLFEAPDGTIRYVERDGRVTWIIRRQ
jgi:hypothetical protein